VGSYDALRNLGSRFFLLGISASSIFMSLFVSMSWATAFWLGAMMSYFVPPALSLARSSSFDE
jgi:hypothetical protein